MKMSSSSNDARLALLRRWAVLLDEAFAIPGTGIRFGLDAFLGLVPGIGDLASPIFTGLLLVTGLRMRLPMVVQARMVLNAGIDMLIGLVPLLGDLADIAWKANVRNLALLERHVRPGVPPARGDYLFVFVAIGLVMAIMIMPFALLVWLLWKFPLV
jgi:hypothetical protein